MRRCLEHSSEAGQAWRPGKQPNIIHAPLQQVPSVFYKNDSFKMEIYIYLESQIPESSASTY